MIATGIIMAHVAQAFLVGVQLAYEYCGVWEQFPFMGR